MTNWCLLRGMETKLARAPGRHANEVGVPAGYRVERSLGEGAEGGAWAGVELSTGARVVLKAVPSGARSSVERAFVALRAAGSPHLPAVKALLPGQGGWWLITGFVEGEPLGPGPVPLARALEEISGLSDALAALHRAGTHHGDVSPANVVRDSDGRVTLVDLGQLGRRGTGTPGFLAPEVLAGGGGPAADRFALGCLLAYRLWGRVPWSRPERLVRVRTARDVEDSLEGLGVGALPKSLQDLMRRLLHPDPAVRTMSSEAITDRLREVAAGAPLAAPGVWRLPSQWPYRGCSLASCVARMASGDPPRLVVVEGPPGSGRARAVEDIIQALQAREVQARIVDPSQLGASWGEPARPWLEAWMSFPPERGILGFATEVEWPPSLTTPELQASVLLAALPWIGCPVVLPASPDLGAALGARGADAPGGSVLRIELRPWTSEELHDVLRPVAPDERLQAWVTVLAGLTGGWPGKTIHVIRACARAHVNEPAAAAIEAAVDDVDREDELDEPVALAVLACCWAGQPDTGLPSHLHDEGIPRRLAVRAAERTLGVERVRALARARLAASASADLGLAVAADDAAAIEAVLAGVGALRHADPAVHRLIAWLERADRAAIGPYPRVLAARYLLRRGDAARAWALVHPCDEPRCRLEAARALQRLGRYDEALALLDGDDNAATQGLRWRIWVDRGEAMAAVAAARGGTVAGTPTDCATAWLWAGYAALVVGEGPLADAWLERALGLLTAATDLEGLAVRGRVAQLLANVAHHRGDLGRAFEDYERAAVAFAAAEDTLGALLVRGSTASLAIPCFDLERGLVHGRAAARGLLAAGHLEALPDAVLNLVQLLLRVDASDEAAIWVEHTAALLDVLGPSTGGAAQRLRMQADLDAAAVVGPTAARAVEAAFVRAARAFEAHAAPREAADTWCRAAAVARVAGRAGVARLHISAARALASTLDDLHPRVTVAIETLRQALGDPSAVALARAELDALGTADMFVQREDLELAWQIDRVTLAALQREHSRGAPPRARVAGRLLRTLERMMQKTPPLDRPAALRVLSREEGGETPVLEALLAETATPSLQAPTSESEPQTQRLLRMYRRFAREDRIEVVLEQVVDAVMDLTEAERGAVVVRGEGQARIEVTRDLANGTDGFRFSQSVIDQVLASGDPVMSVDAAADARFDGSASINHLNLRSVLAVPLRFRGAVLGAVYVDHRLRRGNFDESDLSVVEEFAELASLAVAHAQALASVRAQADQLQRQGRELADLLEARDAEVVELRQEVLTSGAASREYRGIVGGSTAMQKVFRLVERVADASVPVVIHGESGTGKELVARAIHAASRRAHGPFIAENCGAIPETLLESVLFGHAKGAFTGASAAKIGLFEAAHGGTIFLDEVGEMSPAMQTKLLRVLQEGEVRRVGETQSRTVDVRIIAASNRDLEAMVAKGTFRQDLFYRIHVVKVELPALRQRAEDIPVLISHFVARHGATPIELTPAARRAMASYGWPGNVRELENEVQRWLALCDGRIDLDDLSPNIAGVDQVLDPDDLRIRPRVDRLERELIARAFERTRGNQTRAAEMLGLSRYGLQKKLKRLEDDGLDLGAKSGGAA